MQLTDSEFLIGAAVVLLALAPFAVRTNRRRGVRLAGVWVPAAMLGIYLWLVGLTYHERWLEIVGVGVLVASYAMRLAIWRSDRRRDAGR